MSAKRTPKETENIFMSMVKDSLKAKETKKEKPKRKRTPKK